MLTMNEYWLRKSPCTIFEDYFYTPKVMIIKTNEGQKMRWLNNKGDIAWSKIIESEVIRLQLKLLGCILNTHILLFTGRSKSI